ncbi:MAG: TrkA family potassium uptake protein [Coriobacteriia bacterium]|nr:TrkA family potassium uptake protein [Coriobacteriia bacterium]
MDAIVVGCGRVGSELAIMLSRNGHNVSVIDKDPSSFKRLGRNFNGRTIKGMGFDEDVLEQAGVEHADVVASVTSYDNTNLMVAEVARRLFNVPHVITRLYNSNRVTAYEQLGIDFVLGTSLISEEIYSKILSGHANHIDIFGDVELLSFNFNSPNGPVKVRDVEKDNLIKVIAFKHEESYIIPVDNSLLHDEDLVLVAIHSSETENLSRYFRD